MKKRVLLLLLPLAACSDTLAPTTSACESLSDLTAGLTSPAIPREDLRSALLHAAGPMTSALPTDANMAEVRLAAMSLAVNVATLEREDGCGYLRTASAALNALPDDPATRPDRAGIRLVLGLTAQSFVSLVAE